MGSSPTAVARRGLQRPAEQTRLWDCVVRQSLAGSASQGWPHPGPLLRPLGRLAAAPATTSSAAMRNPSIQARLRKHATSRRRPKHDAGGPRSDRAIPGPMMPSARCARTCTLLMRSVVDLARTRASPYPHLWVDPWSLAAMSAHRPTVGLFGSLDDPEEIQMWHPLRAPLTAMRLTTRGQADRAEMSTPCRSCARAFEEHIIHTQAGTLGLSERTAGLQSPFV